MARPLDPLPFGERFAEVGGAKCGTASYAETLTNGNGSSWIVIFNRLTETLRSDTTLIENVRVMVTSQLDVNATVNQSTFAVGQTLTVSAMTVDPGLPGSADLYLGALLPDGVTIVFWTGDGNTALGSRADLRSFRPCDGRLTHSPFSTNMPNVF